MTPPGGSRDDDDSAPRGEPTPGPSRSSPPGSSPGASRADALADEPGSDPQLRAMRAVWLAMRDEDPPDRGLAELLAAARHKAEAMQPRPSAWQRLLAALRRPPVLALATVTVLIAGAVLIGRRIPRGTAPGLTASHEAAGPARPAATGDGVGWSDGDLGARREATRTQSTEPAAAAPGGAPAVSAPQPAAPPPAATALAPDRGSVRPAPHAHLETTPSPSISTARSTPGDTPRDDDRAAAGPAPAAPAPAPTPPERVTQLGASAAVPGAGTAGGNNARSFARPPSAEPEAQAPTGASNDGRNDTARSAANRTANHAANNAANNAAETVANGVAEPARRPSPAPPRPDAPGDLSRQCEAAALRGDCAAVRKLVDRISRTDRGYRARVAKDSPVGKCLAE